VATERTLVLVKPDGVRRGLAGEVVSRLEKKGLALVAMELRILDRATAEEHYGEHRERPFFGELVEFITGGRSSRSSSRARTPSPRCAGSWA
jgi:nucleoside-diphosphate kinase